MLKHLLLLVMFSGLLHKSLQEVDELVLAHSKDGKRYIAKKGKTNIDEDVGTDYSRVTGKVALLVGVFIIFVIREK